MIPYGSCRLCYAVNLTRDVNFHLYTRQNPKTSYMLKLGNETNLANSQFYPKHPTVIYIHGYAESASSESPSAILKDWINLAAAPYYNYAVENAELVGSYTAQFVNWLESQNQINIKDLHVIGFSLGAHVAGFMGKELAPKKVGRITGLDPAAPLFPSENITCRLDKTDARFVDVIHTSSNHGAPGIRNRIGHVDFYPNRGFMQPGCEGDSDGTMICSHRRAWNFYVESVFNPYGFPASRCQSLRMLMKDRCAKSNDAFMGFDVNKKTRGIFTLQTNSKPPFATDFSEYIKLNAAPNKESDSKSKNKNCNKKLRNKMMRRNKKKSLVNEEIKNYLDHEYYKTA
ncbi:hypothetical protein PV325_005100 [Microctonus aethiopoides]|nr:hypothetical protein PV325_005100 [Microctonus aethiopoides]